MSEHRPTIVNDPDQDGEALDADLDAPTALGVIDRAVAAGNGAAAREAAAMMGFTLSH